MAAYKLDVLSFQKSNILFIIFAHYLEGYIEYFIHTHTLSHSTTLVINRFMWLHKLHIAYLYVLQKYYHNEKDEGVLGYPIQGSQHDINFRK